ncbi:hypothetical protein [Thermincola ferriacetica]
MLVVVAAVASAAVSWLGNKILTRLWKTEGIMFITPLLEETAKTLSAVLLQQSVVLVHGAFGVIEAGYDLTIKKQTSPIAALVSLLGHLFYGIITLLGFMKWGTWPGIMLAYAAHTFWNVFILKALRDRQVS